MSHDGVRFMILGQGRTGSTMLVQALNSHPAIVCFGEIFNASTASVQFDIDGYSKNGAADLAQRSADYDAFLKQRIFCNHGTAIRAVGFKFHYDHFWHYEGIPRYFAEDVGLRVVHLTRRNRLRTLVSTRIAEQSGRWLEYAPEPPLTSRLRLATVTHALRDPARAINALRRKFDKSSLPPATGAPRLIEVSPEELRTFCERTAYSERHWAELMSQHGIITIQFEDLVSDRESVVAEVEGFLGIEPAPSVVSLRRQNPEPLRELIANFDELRAAFAASPQAWMFDE